MNNNIKFYKCHNFGHYENECRIKLNLVKMNSNLQPIGQRGAGVWRKKLDHYTREENNLVVDNENHHALHGQKKGNSWCVDSRCSKHMTKDKDKFMELDKNKRITFTFRNNASSQIVGRGIVQLGSERLK